VEQFELCVLEAKLSTDVDHFPLGLEPIPHAQHAVALAEHYLNARQHKLGTGTGTTKAYCPRRKFVWLSQLIPKKN
jgi:hypothetical protein